ncbi:MAG: hypothetical protein IT424_09755 [Pirellulales bacterium]|nr:hypothetical protein [Pirellulales bacterium]
MAREERDREDLLRDARALVPRVGLQVELGGRRVEVFAGFRGDALSLFFDQDLVYHFNAAGELRRAFVGGRLIKAERRRLVALDRRRSAGEVVLEREELSQAAERSLLDAAMGLLEALAGALDGGNAEALGEEPAGGKGLSRLREWLGARDRLNVAASARL